MLPDPPTVTPTMVNADMARDWLSTIGTQRIRRPLYVESIAQSYLRGEARWSNDLIAFVGKLGEPGCRQRNGQHRTEAVVRADEAQPGIEVPLLVGEGFTDDAALAFDTGLGRTLADTLDFQEGPAERPSHRDLAAVANLTWHITAGTWANRTPKATRIQMVEFIKDNPDLLDVVDHARTLQRGIGGGFSGYGAAIWLIARGSHVGRLGHFIEAAATGEMLKATDPPYQLRETIRRAREVGHVGGERSIRNWWIAATVVQAWNAYVAGERPKRFPPLRRVDPFPGAA